MLSLWAAAASANVNATRALLRSARQFAATTAARASAAGAATRRRRGGAATKTATAASTRAGRGAADDAALVVALRLRCFEDIGAGDDALVAATLADADADASSARRGARGKGGGGASKEGGAVAQPDVSASGGSASESESESDRAQGLGVASSKVATARRGSSARRSAARDLVVAASRSASPVPPWTRSARRRWTPLHCALRGLESMLALHRSTGVQGAPLSRPSRRRDVFAPARADQHAFATPSLVCASGERLASREQIVARYREVVALLLDTLDANDAARDGVDCFAAIDDDAASLPRSRGDARAEAAASDPVVAHLAQREAQRAECSGGARRDSRRGAARRDALDARDADGCTALVYAIRAGAPLIAQQLLRAGASATCADRCGNTPQHYAWAFCDERTRDLLLHVLRGDEARAAAESPRGGGGGARAALNDLGQAPDEVAGCRERLTAPLRALRGAARRH